MFQNMSNDLYINLMLNLHNYMYVEPKVYTYARDEGQFIEEMFAG